MSRARGYETEAIVLRTVPFGETSQVVHLATPAHGLVAALAKGARRAGPEFQGGLSLATMGRASLVPRRGELELLGRFTLEDRLRGLVADLDRFYGASYVIDLLRAWMRPALPNEGLYRAGRRALKALAGARHASVPAWVVWFETRAVTAAGLRPRLHGCAACGDERTQGEVFAPEAGGLTHAACAPSGPRRRLQGDALRAVRRLYEAELEALAREPPTPREVREVRAVNDLWIPHVLERRPASLATVPRPHNRGSHP